MMERFLPRWLRLAAGTWFLLCGASLGVALEMAWRGALGLPLAHARVVVTGGALLAAAWVGVGVVFLAAARRRHPMRSSRQRSTGSYLHAPLH